MARNSCILYPEVNGKPSKMYKDLLEKNKLGRPLVNMLYASYIASNAADAMDQAGYQRNSQGEHNAADVMKFLDVYTMLNEIGSLNSEEISWGITDNNGNRIDFTDGKQALEKTDAFNDAHTGLTATVVQHGDIYNIIAAEKNSRTHTYAMGVKEKLKIWDAEKQAFAAVGIDIENMPQELKSTFTPTNNGLVTQLQNLQRVAIGYLYKKDAMLLFNMDANSPQVQRLINSFGSIEAAAQAMDDINHNTGSYNNAQKTLLARAVNHCKNYRGIDLNALKTQVDQMSQQVIQSSPEEAVKQVLHQLNKKYKIDINEIHRIGNKINTLSEAAADAAVTLQRQIRQLEQQIGNNVEGKRLEGVLNQLMRELANKKYYSGVLNFLNEAQTQISEIDNMLNNIPQTGTELEKAFETARVLQDIKSLKEQYYPLVSALADEHLTIDESIGQTDINNIRQSAKDLKEFFDKKERVLDNLTESTMINLMTQIMGSTAPNGQAMINVIRMAAADSSISDYLYSVGRASNPIIAAMGTIIRNAQDSRDGIMNNMSIRIRRATDKLYKSGSNSSFMYEDDGHIISDIDWGLYKAARTAHIKDLYRQGLRGFDLKQAIEDWEDANTEDRVVDNTNGRTERVPDHQYRKPFQQLTQAQQEYYDEMMQLKGEIGSLLPAYAQKQYLPPQLRRNMLDALGQAKDVKDVAKALRNKFENVWKVREDDDNYNMNGIIDGDEYLITEGAFDNTPLRQIPIFFVNKVEQDELLKNFSSGIAALAGTAVNYDAMSNIAQVVEFIGDFTKGQVARDKEPKADIIENKQIRIFKDLFKWGKNTNTAGLIDGFISQHIYGQRRNPNEEHLLTRLFDKIIAYTSFKGLVTNVPGAVANFLVGEFQMLIEAGAGEYYNLKDYAWAHSKLFGTSGVAGDIMELLTNNMSHKATLFREKFDPLNENFSDKSHTKYYKSMFRQLVSHDCSFIGYSSGEYLIHYVNMYGILHNTKLLLNGKRISLYDAFEVVNSQDGNSELRLKNGVTMLDNSPVTSEYIESIRKKIRYCNQTCHGAMNAEDKGLIHQHWWGRGIMNFRQWAIEHYSRRFRKRHFDASLGMEREGYWTSYFHYLFNEDTKEQWDENLLGKAKVIGTTLGESVSMALPWFMRDYMTFMLRAQSQWSNLDEMQRYNVKRVHQEMMMYIALLGLSFALGEPDKHKKEFWRRWWIYQTKRMILETEASMPNPKALSSLLTMLNSPMAGVNTLNSLLYTFFYGPFNGDLIGPNSTIKTGKHKGKNRYWRNFLKYMFPFTKDIERLQTLDEDDSIFQVFKDTPSNY